MMGERRLELQLVLLLVKILGSALLIYSTYNILQQVSVKTQSECCSRSKKMKQQDSIVEICVSDYESAKQAIEGGAMSLELCSNRLEGGTTPSVGLVESCVELVKGTNVTLHVLIRPRPGDFSYSDEEFEVIQRDILAAKQAGADGKTYLIISSFTTDPNDNALLQALCVVFSLQKVK
jgi:hypothetical protein